MAIPQRVLPTAVVLILAALLLGESLAPGRVFLPLLPGDFQTWREGTFGGDAPSTHPHPNWTMSDVVHLFVPGLAVTRAAVERGELPLWDPTQACGVPHLAQVHYGVLYPPAWLPLIFGWSGLALTALLHLLIAGLGMATWLSALGRSPAASALGAVSFAGSAWVTARLHAFPVIGALVWLPLILWGLERGARGHKRGYLVAAIGCALSLFAGFPQITLWVFTVAGVVELLRAAGARRRGDPAWGAFWRGATAMSLGLALSLPQLLPTMDYVANESARTGSDPEHIAAQSLEAPLLWHLLVPDRYAAASVPAPNPIALGDLDIARSAGSVNRPEVSMSIGVLGLLLALLAMFTGRSARIRCLTVGVLLLGTLLLWPTALRAGAALFPVLRFGSPLRLLAITTFLLAALAAEGLDLLVARGWRAAVGLALSALAVLAALLLMSLPPAAIDAWAESLKQGLGFAQMSLAELYQLIPAERFQAALDACLRSRGLGIAAALAAFVVFLPFARRGVSRCLGQRAPALIVLLALVELTLMAQPLLRAAPAGLPSGLGPDMTLTSPELARATRAAAVEPALPPRVVRWGSQALHVRPNWAGMFGMHDLQACAPMAPRRVVELLQAFEPELISNGSTIGGFVTEEALTLPGFDLLGVDVVLAEDPRTPAGFVDAGLVGRVRLLRNTEALPRAFLVDQRGARVVADAAERLSALSAPDFDPRAQVLLSADTDLPVPSADSATAPITRQLEVSAYRAGSVSLRVAAGAPAWLVFTETWHKGWRARVDGRDVPTQVADHAFVGVRVDSTEPLDVELSFEPRLSGPLVWIGAALALLLLGLLSRRRA